MSTPETKAWGSQCDGTHYKTMAIQPMEYSMANNLNSLQHTIVKYVSRYKDKNGVADLKKAKHCIQMLIDWEVSLGPVESVHKDAERELQNSGRLD